MGVGLSLLQYWRGLWSWRLLASLFGGVYCTYWSCALLPRRLDRTLYVLLSQYFKKNPCTVELYCCRVTCAVLLYTQGTHIWPLLMRHIYTLLYTHTSTVVVDITSTVVVDIIWTLVYWYNTGIPVPFFLPPPPLSSFQQRAYRTVQVTPYYTHNTTEGNYCTRC